MAGGDILRDQALRPVLTREQVAELLQVKPRQLDRLGVPCLHLGHKTKRYLAKDVLAWLEEHCRSRVDERGRV